MASWMMVWPGMLALGAVVGFLGGLLGIGGGILAIPVLALLFGMDQAMAQGTALVMIAPNVVLAFWRYSQHHPIALRRTLTLGAV
ncbi:TSUP family transporter, partial [Rivihabitans pingtungensis]|uniref:TSUP family transporter n=1 Tax=Rivihabitans pingtungensis TaxID=1054498 RepID=UPI002FDAEE8C